MKFVLFLVVFVTVASASQRADEIIKVNVNKYVDYALPLVRDFILANNLDPMSIPDVSQTFQAKPLFITYSGTLNLTQGVLSNLVSVKRQGDVILTYQRKTLDLDALISCDSVIANYDYSVKIILIGTSGQLVGTGNSIDIDIGFTFDLNQLKIALKYLDVSNIGSVGVNFKGNPLVDWLTNALANVVTLIFKDNIIRQVVRQATVSIDNAIDNVNNVLEIIKS